MEKIQQRYFPYGDAMREQKLRAPKDLFKKEFLLKRGRKRKIKPLNGFSTLVIFPFLLSFLPDYFYMLVVAKPGRVNDLIRAVVEEPAIKLDTWIQFFTVIGFLGLLAPLIRWFSDRGGDVAGVSRVFKSDDYLKRLSKMNMRWKRYVEGAFRDLSAKEYRSLVNEIHEMTYRGNSEAAHRVLNAEIVSLLFYWALVLPLWDLLFYFAVAREIKYGVSFMVCLIFIGILAWLYNLFSDYLNFTYFRMSRLSVSAFNMIEYIDAMDDFSFSYRRFVDKQLLNSALPRVLQRFLKVFLLGPLKCSYKSISIWLIMFVATVCVWSLSLGGLTGKSLLLGLFVFFFTFAIVSYGIHSFRSFLIDIPALGYVHIFMMVLLVFISVTSSVLVVSLLVLLAVSLGLEWAPDRIITHVFFGVIVGTVLTHFSPFAVFGRSLNLRFEKSLFFSVDWFFLTFENSGVREVEKEA